MIRNSLRGLRALALVLVALLLLGSCVEDKSPAGPAFDVVGQDALAVLVIERPARLYAGLDALWAAAGVDQALGLRLADLLASAGPGVNAAGPLLDTARPLILACYPGGGGSGMDAFTLRIYLPFKGSEASLRSALAADESTLVLAVAKNYAVLGPNDQGEELEFPPRKPLDLGALKRYPAEALKFWAVPGFFTALSRKPGFEGFKDDFRGLTAEPGAPENPGLAELKELGEALLAEVGAFHGALLPSRAGLLVRAGVDAVAGGKAESMIARAAAAPSALELAQRLDPSPLYSYAWSLDPALSSELGMAYARIFMKALDRSGELGALMSWLQDYQKRWAAASGPRGTLGLDLDFDAQALQNAAAGPGADTAALLEQAIRFRMDFSQEVRDEAAYWALMKEYGTNPQMAAYMDFVGRQSGLAMKLRTEEKRAGAFRYGELNFDYAPADPSDSRFSDASSQMVFAFMQKLLSFRYTLAGGRFLMTNGELGVLKGLVERPMPATSLAADSAFKTFAAAIPGKPIMIGSFSTRRFAALVTAAMPPEAKALVDPARFGAWYSYLAAEGKSAAGAARLETGLAIPASDLGAAFGLFAAAKGAGAP